MRKVKNISVILIFEKDCPNQLERLKIINNKILSIFDRPEIILITGHNDKYLLTSKYCKNTIKIKNDSFNNTVGAKALSLGLYAISNESVLIVSQDAAPIINKLHSSKFLRSTVFLDKKIDTNVGANETTEKNLQNLWFDLPLKFSNMFYLAEPELEIVKTILVDDINDRLFIFEIINQSIEEGAEYEVSL